jgi:site-specific recombinase XerC
MQTLVEDFLQYLRHERGQAEHTQKTYAALLGKFITWAVKQNLTDWKQVELRHLMSFLQHERERALANQPKVFILKSPRCARFTALPKTKNYCRKTSRKIFHCRAVGNACPRR